MGAAEAGNHTRVVDDIDSWAARIECVCLLNF